MKLNHQNNAQLTVVEVSGELTADHADTFRKEASERFEENICDFVIDVSEMEFVDSAGLEAFLWLQEQCAERLGQVRLANVGESVETILRLTRLDARFEAFPDVEAAVKSLH